MQSIITYYYAYGPPLFSYIYNKTIKQTITNQKVKQIVGSTLTDDKQNALTATSSSVSHENFSTDKPASEYAHMYQTDKLTGGHVIMLGPGNTDAAKSALSAYPNGLQIGGGITIDNAQEWLEYGASHVIVTSYVFHNGTIDYDRLDKLVALIGKEKLVLDLSCRRRSNNKPNNNNDNEGGAANVQVNEQTLHKLSTYCNEFLVHGVENEGKRCGILEDLVLLLGTYSPIPVTYAGGVHSIRDLDRVKELGRGKVDLTIGSALDCFGGDIRYCDVVDWHRKENP